MLKTLLMITVILGAALCACATLAKPQPKTRTVHLTNANTVLVSGSIDMVSVDGLIAATVGKRIMLPPEETLYVVIISGGGNYQAALAFQAFMVNVPNVEVYCKYCASAAGMLFADSGKHRIATAKSEMLMHEMYMNHVTANMVANHELAAQLQKYSDEFDQKIYSHIGITKEAYQKKIQNTEWTVVGQLLVKLHLADEMVKITCDQFESRLLPDTCS